MKAAKDRYRELPWVSITLVAVNVAVFIVCCFDGGWLYAKGRLSALEVLVNGEFGRIIWSMFLHAGSDHLFNNMLILLFMGAMIEKEIGHSSFAACYFLSGIGGNLLSLTYKLMTNDWSASVGASGAVFGLDGMLLAMVLFSGRRLPTVTPVRVVLMILLSLYSGLTGGNIDNAAHIGGLLTGFLVGTVICSIQRRHGRKQQNQDNRTGGKI